MNKQFVVGIVVAMPGGSPTVIKHTATGLIWSVFFMSPFVFAVEILTLTINMCLWVVM
jgi:hypothetical protein